MIGYDPLRHVEELHSGIYQNVRLERNLEEKNDISQMIKDAIVGSCGHL